VKRALPLLALALGACAQQQAHVAQVHEVVREVAVPTPVPTPVACVDPSAIPAEPRRVSGRFNGEARHDLKILAPNAQELRAWGQALRRLVDKCVAKAPSLASAAERGR
jgi:hypothetical protein